MIGRGRHTTTAARLLRGNDVVIVDTPGIRGFALAGIAPEALGDAFPEIAALAPACRFRGCLHVGEAGCAVAGAIDERRLASYRKLLGELRGRRRRRLNVVPMRSTISPGVAALMSHRIPRSVLATLAVALLVAACGGGGKKSSTSSSSAGTPLAALPTIAAADRPRLARHDGVAEAARQLERRWRPPRVADHAAREGRRRRLVRAPPT